MSRESDTTVLDKLFEPVSQCFTPDVARRIAGLRAVPEVQARIDELADKCSEGTLSSDERHLYETYGGSIHFIDVLQAKPRNLLLLTHTHGCGKNSWW